MSTKVADFSKGKAIYLRISKEVESVVLLPKLISLMKNLQIFHENPASQMIYL